MGILKSELVFMQTWHKSCRRRYSLIREREQTWKLNWAPKEFFFFSLVDQSSWKWRKLLWPLFPFVIEYHYFILSLSCLRFTDVNTKIIISSLCIHIYTKKVFQKVKLYLNNCFMLGWQMFKLLFEVAMKGWWDLSDCESYPVMST